MTDEQPGIYSVGFPDRLLAERVPLRLDVARLREDFDRHVRPLPKVNRSDKYGGWSVWSRTGDVGDGWEYADADFVEVGGQWARQRRVSTTPALGSEWKYTTPTPACVGAIAEAVAAIQAYGFQVARVRFALLQVGGEYGFHRDGLDDEYVVRLHVPIITNQGCWFITKSGGVWMPADGAGYVVSVAQLHKIVNYGSTERLHLFMTIRDPRGVTEHFRQPAAP